jgi:hypothetical protein
MYASAAPPPPQGSGSSGLTAQALAGVSATPLPAPASAAGMTPYEYRTPHAAPVSPGQEVLAQLRRHQAGVKASNLQQPQAAAAPVTPQQRMRWIQDSVRQ